MRLIKTKRTIDINGNSRMHASIGRVRTWQYLYDDLSDHENHRRIALKLIDKLGWEDMHIIGSTFFNNDHFVIVEHKELDLVHCKGM